MLSRVTNRTSVGRNIIVGELTRVTMHPSGIKPHAYFIVLQGLNFRKNYVNRNKFGIQGAYQPFVAMTTENL